MTKICIYGLGAVGGLLAARLARSGVAVNAVARGATLAAVHEKGLSLRETVQGQPVTTQHAVHATDNPVDLGVQDVVVVAVKTTGLAGVAAGIAPLMDEHTTVLSAMNGVPWWFFHGMAPELASLKLDSVDPGGALSRAIRPERVVGCVTHLSATTPAPGVVQHVAGQRLIVGEPVGGADSARSRHLIQLLRNADFDVDPAASIQREIWFKLWGNMTVNPISALTGATGDRILDDELVRAFMSRCMRESAAIGERIGLPIDADPEGRHAVTRQLGAFRTSMLQDAEAGKPLEIDALVRAVVEIARQLGVPTPEIDTLLGLARLKARVAGLYPDAA
ncbi:2-dehydropantoate 2-reductase [Hydrogenophaga sp.]|uniref:2-dehydropantoate 2-reductase n=1 Tax=Hydrogenophaga sp. TaxID=1904254 RepID=UPI0026318B8B|nr:2-dehydropantoate 2-reductase [Hydrogenophaga sp.]MCW5654482.1 2-dehydropantoate 2-reductase [Hydrogenophaga sp.]